ncbi:Amyloid-like protein 2 [Homalodisca vitripennis]|nr:Amyloid-like protein 2 [Homalodisca vitripennis]
MHLAPCDFFLFPKLKKPMKQRRYATIKEMKTLKEELKKITKMNTHRVQKCLQKLLRSLHKDRHHTISHYRHLLSSSLEQAEREKAITLEHLVDIDHTVNQSLQMLQR